MYEQRGQDKSLTAPILTTVGAIVVFSCYFLFSTTVHLAAFLWPVLLSAIICFQFGIRSRLMFAVLAAASTVFSLGLVLALQSPSIFTFADESYGALGWVIVGGNAGLCFVLGAIGYLLGRLWSRGAPRVHGICSRCGYDLRGNKSGTCSECGLKIAPPQSPA